MAIAKKKCLSSLPMYETGAALAVGLVFLLIMTLIGVAGMTLSVQQEKMSGHFIERAWSNNRAESLQTAIAVNLMPLVDGYAVGSLDITTVSQNENCTGSFITAAYAQQLPLTSANRLGFDDATDQYAVVKVPQACIAESVSLDRRSEVMDFYWLIANATVETTARLYGSFVIWIPPN